VDVGGIPGIIGWERWAGGTYQASSTGGAPFTTTTLSANDGIHFIHGSSTDPGTLPTPGSWDSGASGQYSLGGRTRPTLLGGAVVPGTLMTDSKLGINFSTLTVGVDLGVQIGGGTYRITTPGGANAGAGDLPLTGVLFASSAQNVGVNVITPSAGILCTTGN